MSQYPFRMLGQTGKGFVRKKRMCPGCVCGIRVSCSMGRCRKAAGNRLVLRVTVCIKPQRRGTEQEEFGQGEEGGKIGLLEAEWVC